MKKILLSFLAAFIMWGNLSSLVVMAANEEAMIDAMSALTPENTAVYIAASSTCRGTATCVFWFSRDNLIRIGRANPNNIRRTTLALALAADPERRQSLTEPSNTIRTAYNLSTIPTPPAAPPVAPAPTQVGHITSGVNFRTGSGNTHSVIRSLAEGTSFTFLREQNGWWHIRVGNQEGWVHGNHATLATSTGHVTSGANFRTGAGNTHSVIRSLSQGTYFTFLREQNGWWNIRVGNQEGWIHGNHATLGISTGHTLGGVSFRTGAGNTHSIIRSLPQGTSFTYVREQNGWWQIRIGTQTGWIHGNNATFGTTAGHVTSGVNFRTGAGNNHSVIRSLSEGTSFTFLREQNGWWNIQIGNQTGWIHGNHGGFGTSNGVITSGVNFRMGAGNTHGIISSLIRGTNFTFLSEQNGWWNIRVGNQEGWVHGNHATLGMLPMLVEAIVELPQEEIYYTEYSYMSDYLVSEKKDIYVDKDYFEEASYYYYLDLNAAMVETY